LGAFDGLLLQLAPDEAGVLWIALLVTFLVFGDRERPFSTSNLQLCLLLLLAPCLLDILSQSRGRYAPIIWSVILVVTLGYLVWALALSRGSPSVPEPQLPRGGLRTLLVLLLALDFVVVFGRPPDDAGRYTNLGTQRWLETSELPYGDVQLSGPDSPARGAAATYGPVLYAAHIPTQLLLGAQRNPPEAAITSASYRWPPPLATQLTSFGFFVLGMAALFGIVRRYSGTDMALGVAAVWAASPFVIGLGGDVAVVGGLRYISHTAPSALTLAAFLLLPFPFAAGAVLALAAGSLFYPVFIFPAWLGWYVWRDWRMALRFGIGFAAISAVLGAVVLSFTSPSADQSAIGLFFESTFGHQEGTATGQYGGSMFGFWGTNPRASALMQQPVVGSSFALRPIFLLYGVLVAASFFLARGRTGPQLAAVTAAVTAGLQLWKTHGGGTYVAWYYPFLLIGVFTAAGAAARKEDNATDVESRTKMAAAS
jgi:hypothetical protein